jgi:ribosomal protein S18
MDNKNKKRTTKTIKIKVNMVTMPSYKVPASLSQFISSRGMIYARSKTSITAKQQRRLTTEIKRARFMALIPYTYRHEI